MIFASLGLTWSGCSGTTNARHIRRGLLILVLLIADYNMGGVLCELLGTSFLIFQSVKKNSYTTFIDWVWKFGLSVYFYYKSEDISI